MHISLAEKGARAEMSLDNIDMYFSQLEVFRNYTELKNKLEQAVTENERIRDKPIKLLSHILEELQKPKDKRSFTQEELDSGLVNKIEAMIEREVSKRIDYEILRDRIFRSNEK
jgi:hypothetical protein